jgi:chromosome partitioning protein
MTRIIALANQKGGVGKTTSAVNIACGLARKLGPERVLLVDIDPQANATHVLLGLAAAAGPRQAGAHTVKEVLLEEVAARDAIRAVSLDAAEYKGQTRFPASSLHILPSHLELVTVEPHLTSTFRGEYHLQEAMVDVDGNYAYIVVDCPPSLGALTLNALIYCDEVVIPVDPGEFALVGLGLLQSTIQKARRANPRLRIGGVLPNSIEHTRLSQETLAALQDNFGDLVLPAVPKRVAIGEAHSSGEDIFSYAPDSDGAAAYAAIIEELIAHDQA